jgi:hypothetical protein
MPTYKIHPAVGFARVGNSPEYFIGPEKRHQVPSPIGGFKDLLCRVKRQAARFRIFTYPDGGGDPVELDLTASGTSVAWTVGVNGAPDGSVSPGAPPTMVYETGTTILRAELRTDAAGRLLALAGMGYVAPGMNGIGPDDTCDGYVRASLTIGGIAQPVVGGWVVMSPPKFAPQLDSVVTLWDVTENRLHGAGALTTPVSYTEHIYPVLRRAQATRWVRAATVGHHSWNLEDPGSLPRQQIFDSLRVPAGVPPPPAPAPGSPAARSMPDISSFTLTRLQYLRFQVFAAPAFTHDWTSAPSSSPGEPTASELDRSALEACNGGPFSQGVEVAKQFAFDTTFDPLDPLRIRTSTRGQLRPVETPWVTDYLAGCAAWWPIVRPNEVLRRSGASFVTAPWFTGSITQSAILDWPALGFVTYDAASDQYVEEQCSTRLRPPPRFWFTRLLRIPIADPPPFDVVRVIRSFALRALEATAAPTVAPPDTLSRLMRDLDRMDEAEMRASLVELRADIARLETAARLLEGRLKGTTR